MKCTEIKRFIKSENKYEELEDNAINSIHDRVRAHVESCGACRQEVALEQLTLALLSAYTASEKQAGEPADLMARIRSRIRELSEQ